LDTISTGGVIAYMMEMTEKGIHDFDIRFGESVNESLTFSGCSMLWPVLPIEMTSCRQDCTRSF